MADLKRFHNMSIRYRLVLSFLVVMIPSVIFLGLAAASVSTNIVTELVLDSSDRVLDRTALEINNLFKEVLDVSMSFREDPFIQRALRREFSTIGERYSLDLEADNELSYISAFKDDIFGLYVLGVNGSSFKSSIRSFKSVDFYEREWFHRIMTADESVWFGPYKGSMAVNSIGEELIAYGLPIVDKATGRRIGVILTEIETALLQDTLIDRMERGGSIRIEHPSGIIEDERANIILDTSLSGEDYGTDEPEKGTRLNRGLLIPEWQLTAILELHEVSSENRYITFVVIILLFVISVFFIIIAWLISGSIVAPIQDIIRQMKLAQEGDLSVSVIVDYDNEIGDLSRNFNRMIRRINHLIDDLNDQHKQLRKSQLEVLQAQINPHFLYNTLESIIWLSRQKKNMEIIRMVEALTGLFRISISRGEDIIPIDKEVEHIRNYLVIQHIRYRNKFSYEIEIDDDISGYLSLKLILQPIVENAIYHGVKMKREKGRVRIRGYRKGDDILFDVFDTGPGLTPETTAELKKVLAGVQSAVVKSYGLKNVQERINIFFGEGYGLDFLKTEEGGTLVRIRIPCIREVGAHAESFTG